MCSVRDICSEETVTKCASVFLEISNKIILSFIGFLNLKLPDCPGNVGIKDLIMALQWVQENIECFGGNPKQVTLCGQCTGASLIHFLMMSPLAKGNTLISIILIK